MFLSPTYAEAVKEDQLVSNNLKSKTKKVAPIMVTTTDFVFDSILVQVHLLICLKLPPVTIPMTTGQAQQKWWWSLKILNWHLIRFDLMEKNDPPLSFFRVFLWQFKWEMQAVFLAQCPIPKV